MLTEDGRLATLRVVDAATCPACLAAVGIPCTDLPAGVVHPARMARAVQLRSPAAPWPAPRLLLACAEHLRGCAEYPGRPAEDVAVLQRAAQLLLDLVLEVCPLPQELAPAAAAPVPKGEA